MNYLTSLLPCTGTDQAVFIRRLSSKLLSKRENADQNIDKFIDDFKKYFSSNELFLKSLSPTLVSNLVLFLRKIFWIIFYLFYD